LGVDTLETTDVQDEDYRSTDFDFEVLSQVHEAWFQRWRVWNRDLSSPVTDRPDDPEDIGNLVIVDSDEQTRISGTKQAARATDLGHSIALGDERRNQVFCVLVLNNGNDQFHQFRPGKPRSGRIATWE
jgi:hypothetical protein